MKELIEKDTVQIRILPESPRHIKAIHNLNASAFETEAEAKLVDALREACPEIISLVAEINNITVGHILFSPVTVHGKVTSKLMGLAPMAVSPDRQNQGIGSLLVREGLAACKAAGYEGVVVLGHPSYYPRFGFQPSVRWGIRSEYTVPDEVFMALEFTEGSLHSLKGAVIRYHPVFQSL